MTSPPVARVLLDSPLPQLDRLFDYAIPAELAERAVPGVRVKVPLRSAGRMVEGHIVERGERDEGGRPLSELDSVVSDVQTLPSSLYALARRAADRAAGSASDVLRLVIPKRMVRAEKSWAAAPAPETPVVGEDAAAWAAERLSGYPDLTPGLVAGERLAVDAPPRPGDGVPAWAELVAAMAVDTLGRGRSTVIVVPDHRDEAHVLDVLARHLSPDAVIRDDARRSGPERYASYLRLLAPVPCVVVGNRSSVYAPAHDVGTVIVWDDGDSLMTEPLSPGIHCRDAALVRQELQGHALVFAGLTRTTDVERLVALGWVREAPATRRESPRVVLSATREGETRGTRVPSAAFAAAREALTEGPVLVQVARPGYAPVLVCADCRTPARCAHCAGPLRAARPGAVPVCGWCGRGAPAWSCASCASVRLRMASSGSERTADELGRAFPNTRVIVADGDHPVARVEARPALIVATRGAEPFAEGGYRAVILLDGDRMLMTEELRIAESCLRWWSHAAALAAPGAPVHLVGVAGPAARALATWTQPAYARSELAERAPVHMPPVVRVAAVTGTSAAVSRALHQLGDDVGGLGEAAVLGPMPQDDGTVRALVRFDYASGRAVAESLRASVVAEAVSGRRRRGDPGPRNTLKVRLDVPDLDL